MLQDFNLTVNGRTYEVRSSHETPLLLILRNNLGIKGPKIACGDERCGSCNVLIDGEAVPSCKRNVGTLMEVEITTIEGLGTAEGLHPLQQAFIEDQATQCGYCTPGMIIAAQGLLNKRRYPTDGEIKSGLENSLCRCGVYDRVRRAIKRRIGREEQSHITSKTILGRSVIQGEEFPQSILETPELDSWIRIDPVDTVTLFTGKVEYGQGIMTALAQVMAEELDLSIHQIRVVMADTEVTPNEGFTVGSMSLETSGNAIRYAAAEARRYLLSIAHEEFEAPIEQLVVSKGVITDPGSKRSISYWDLQGGKPFGIKISGHSRPKKPEDYRILGTSIQRLDLVEIVTGAPIFIQDLDLPSMVHARVVRPPNYGARLISIDDENMALGGSAKIHRDGSFLAVIAESEHEAIQASELLKSKCVWETGSSQLNLDTYLSDVQNRPHQSLLIIDGIPVEDPIPSITTPETAFHSFAATYIRPFQMHASLAPSAAVAQMDNGKLTIWAHSQGIFSLKTSIAYELGLDPESVHVIYRPGAGCYGHTGADDAALDAALIAQALPGRPVSVRWTLPDERKWEPYGPAMLINMQASLDENGKVIDWCHDVWSPPHLGRSRPDPQTSGFAASWYRANPKKPQKLMAGLWREGGAHRNATPKYDFAKCRIVKHTLDESPLRISALRSLGAFANVFAIESFMDELAQEAGIDPLEFRLRHLTDARSIAVLQAAAEKAGWDEKPEHEKDHGYGLAFAQYKNRACYAAVIVELAVNRRNGEIELIRAVIAADAGQIVNSDGLSNQLEGGFVQSASMTLYEEVKVDQHGISSDSWESYPILRFTNSPTIETVLINRVGEPFLGAGEGAVGPTPAAIANAIYDASGIRLRILPFTPDRVLEALAAEPHRSEGDSTKRNA